MRGFPLGLTSMLTGATKSQLLTWRAKGLVVPEARQGRPPLWSANDVVALRSIAFLRQRISLQQVSKAFGNLDLLALREHPSEYRFGTDGRTIFVEEPTGKNAIDLNRLIGNRTLFTFEEIIKPFENFRGHEVSALFTPAEHLSVDFGRVGGWPLIEKTRIPYDTIANLVDGTTVTAADVSHYYPGVSEEAALSAAKFHESVLLAAA